MRPLGFESPTKRCVRSLVLGFVVGIGAMLTVSLIESTGRWTAPSPLPLGVATFLLGFFGAFGLALLWPDFAPPPLKDDGDEEAGVPARLVPPTPTLSARSAAETHRGKN